VNRNIELIARRKKKALAKLRCIGSDVDCVSCRTPTNSGGFGGVKVAHGKITTPAPAIPITHVTILSTMPYPEYVMKKMEAHPRIATSTSLIFV
jgi:hypothetical protein